MTTEIAVVEEIRCLACGVQLDPNILYLDKQICTPCFEKEIEFEVAEYYKTLDPNERSE